MASDDLNPASCAISLAAVSLVSVLSSPHAMTVNEDTNTQMPIRINYTPAHETAIINRGSQRLNDSG
jgi:hypothetical protein